MDKILPQQKRHAHAITGEDNVSLGEFDPLLPRRWKFPYRTFDDRTGFLGEDDFVGTLEEAERESHLRANRFEEAETWIDQITLESQGVDKEALRMLRDI